LVKPASVEPFGPTKRRGQETRAERAASGDAVEEPKPFVPVFVVTNVVRTIDSAIHDVIDASRNLNAETSR